MGSDSDWPVVKGACTVLKDFGVPYEAHILSAHRTPEPPPRSPGAPVPRATASFSALPAWPHTWPVPLPPTPPCRCGHPEEGRRHGRSGRLLATVQMPSGFPVATVALNGAKNAAYLAVAILAVADDELAAKLDSFRADTAAAIAKKDAAISAEAAAL